MVSEHAQMTPLEVLNAMGELVGHKREQFFRSVDTVYHTTVSQLRGHPQQASDTTRSLGQMDELSRRVALVEAALRRVA